MTEFYKGIEVHKLYLSAILDLCDRRIVSDTLSEHNDNHLVFKTFDKAVKVNANAHPLFHGDRGYHVHSTRNVYTWNDAEYLPGRAHCIDNDPMEKHQLYLAA